MASIQFNFIDRESGINTVSFGLTEEHMDRLYSAYQEGFNPYIEPEEGTPPRPDLPRKELLHKICAKILENMLTEIRRAELDSIVKKQKVFYLEVTSRD